MILLDQPDIELAAERQIPSRPRAVDPPAQDQYIKSLRPQPLNRVVPRARINSGSHLYILECPDL